MLNKSDDEFGLVFCLGEGVQAQINNKPILRRIYPLYFNILFDDEILEVLLFKISYPTNQIIMYDV
jgi:hypothetical protein